MTIPNPNRNLDSESQLANLMAEIRARIQAGEKLDLDSLGQHYPGHIDEIRELLPAMQALAELGNSRNSESVASALLPETVAPKQTLGDFRIEREIGRGGMGVVYRAEQLSLGRRVALKVLPMVALLAPKQLERFKHEAQAAAILDHPNIVSVHAVGSERGVHYYAMQLIHGQNLAEIISEFAEANSPQTQRRGSDKGNGSGGGQTEYSPTATLSTQRSNDICAFCLSVAKLGAQAADALEHAHQMGIVHRDIKPSNLLLDRAGHLWITDFGLARLEAEESLTMSGDLLGTLRYMSPEQAAGNRRVVDHRTDIYALGATLYELLTGRAAFSGNDRQELLREIPNRDPPEPRTLNVNVPHDLETIVIKAMEKEPTQRYQTAQQLGDELRRFISGKAIQARRPGMPERLARWSRRNYRLVVSSTAIAMLVLLTTSLVVWRQERRTSQALATVRRQQWELLQEKQKTNEALATIQRQKEQLEEELNRHVLNARIAAQSLSELGNKSYGRNLTHPLMAGQIWQTVLRDAVEFYEPFLSYENSSAEPEQLAQAGRAYGVLGYLYNSHLVNGEPFNRQKSENCLRQGVTLMEQAVAATPDSREYQLRLAGGYEGVAYPLLTQGKKDEALEFRRQALDLAKSLVEKYPECLSCKFQFAQCNRTYGAALRAVGEREASLEHEIWATELMEELHREVGHGFWKPDHLPPNCISLELIFYLRRLSATQLGCGSHEEAIAAFRKAIELFDRLTPEERDYAETRAYWYVGTLHRDFADLLVERGSVNGAMEILDAYTKQCGQRVDSLPGLPSELRRKASAQVELGYALFANGHATEASKCFQSGVDLLETIVAKLPKSDKEQHQLAILLANCPVVELRMPDRAMELARPLVEQRQSDPHTLQLMGLCSYRIGKHDDAIHWLERAAALRGQPDTVDALLMCLSYTKLDRPTNARAWLERAEVTPGGKARPQLTPIGVALMRQEAALMAEKGKDVLRRGATIPPYLCVGSA